MANVWCGCRRLLLPMFIWFSHCCCCHCEPLLPIVWPGLHRNPYCSLQCCLLEGSLTFSFLYSFFLCKVYFFTLSDRNVVTIIIWLGTRVLPLYSFSLLDCCCRCLYRLISLSRTFLRLVATGNSVLLFPSEPLVFFLLFTSCVLFIICTFYIDIPIYAIQFTYI